MSFIFSNMTIVITILCTTYHIFIKSLQHTDKKTISMKGSWYELKIRNNIYIKNYNTYTHTCEYSHNHQLYTKHTKNSLS